jgi:heme oxygenase
VTPLYGYDTTVLDSNLRSPAPRQIANLNTDSLPSDQEGPKQDPTPILTVLRRETSAQHAAVEDVIALATALDSLASYGHLLQKFLGLYATLETRVATTPQLSHWLPNMGERIRVPHLVADLTALGMSHNGFEVCHQVMQVSTPAEAFGCLYVLEGSTLGGRMIARQVEASLGLTADNGCMFFSGGGRDIGKMWKGFGESLNAFAAKNAGSNQTIVDSAIATFKLFHKWFLHAGERSPQDAPINLPEARHRT